MTFVSENARAWLLLTAPLIAGNSDDLDTKALSLKEANKLGQKLKEEGREPLDLPGPGRAQLLAKLASILSPERLESLLDRGFQLSQALEKWESRGVWVTSRDDDDYPGCFASKLGERAPILIYGCGDKSLLEKGGLAVVGSRDADDQSLNFTRSVGQLAAAADVNIISGGAKGVDRAAMEASLSSGGTAIGVLAEQLFRFAVALDCHEWIREERLALISLVDPAARFNVGNAMQRNKVIYALGDASLVVSSDVNKGGTWAGAIEQLDRFKSRTLYVRTDEGVPDGNRELQNRGARVWPQPETADELRQLLSSPEEKSDAVTTEPHLPLFAME